MSGPPTTDDQDRIANPPLPSDDHTIAFHDAVEDLPAEKPALPAQEHAESSAEGVQHSESGRGVIVRVFQSKPSVAIDPKTKIESATAITLNGVVSAYVDAIVIRPSSEFTAVCKEIGDRLAAKGLIPQGWRPYRHFEIKFENRTLVQFLCSFSPLLSQGITVSEANWEATRDILRRHDNSYIFFQFAPIPLGHKNMKEAIAHYDMHAKEANWK